MNNRKTGAKAGKASGGASIAESQNSTSRNTNSENHNTASQLQPNQAVNDAAMVYLQQIQQQRQNQQIREQQFHQQLQEQRNTRTFQQQQHQQRQQPDMQILQNLQQLSQLQQTQHAQQSQLRQQVRQLQSLQFQHQQKSIQKQLQQQQQRNQPSQVDHQNHEATNRPSSVQEQSKQKIPAQSVLQSQIQQEIRENEQLRTANHQNSRPILSLTTGQFSQQLHQQQIAPPQSQNPVYESHLVQTADGRLIAYLIPACPSGSSGQAVVQHQQPQLRSTQQGLISQTIPTNGHQGVQGASLLGSGSTGIPATAAIFASLAQAAAGSGLARSVLDSVSGATSNSTSGREPFGNSSIIDLTEGDEEDEKASKDIDCNTRSEKCSTGENSVVALTSDAHDKDKASKTSLRPQGTVLESASNRPPVLHEQQKLPIQPHVLELATDHQLLLHEQQKLPIQQQGFESATNHTHVIHEHQKGPAQQQFRPHQVIRLLQNRQNMLHPLGAGIDGSQTTLDSIENTNDLVQKLLEANIGTNKSGVGANDNLKRKGLSDSDSLQTSYDEAACTSKISSKASSEPTVVNESLKQPTNKKYRFTSSSDMDATKHSKNSSMSKKDSKSLHENRTATIVDLVNPGAHDMDNDSERTSLSVSDSRKNATTNFLSMINTSRPPITANQKSQQNYYEGRESSNVEEPTFINQPPTDLVAKAHSLPDAGPIGKDLSSVKLLGGTEQFVKMLLGQMEFPAAKMPSSIEVTTSELVAMSEVVQNLLENALSQRSPDEQLQKMVDPEHQKKQNPTQSAKSNTDATITANQSLLKIQEMQIKHLKESIVKLEEIDSKTMKAKDDIINSNEKRIGILKETVLKLKKTLVEEKIRNESNIRAYMRASVRSLDALRKGEQGD